MSQDCPIHGIPYSSCDCERLVYQGGGSLPNARNIHDYLKSVDAEPVGKVHMIRKGDNAGFLAIEMGGKLYITHPENVSYALARKKEHED